MCSNLTNQASANDEEAWRRSVTIGDALAVGRRQAGMTVTQVSQRTCIRETIIRGIERDDFSGCGGDFYARGHIRSIARAVAVDPEPLIADYDETMGAPRAISAADVFSPVTPVRLKERRKPNWTAALAVALVAAGGAYGYVHFFAHHQPSSHAGASIKTTPAAHSKQIAKTPPPAPAKPRRLDIKLTATADSWVVLTSKATGVTIFQGTVYAGQSLQWFERHAVTLQIYNPSGVTVTVNGRRERHQDVATPITVNLALGGAKKPSRAG
jgi:cytoskeletal protein RodZ